jgi:hypothetical protein
MGISLQGGKRVVARMREYQSGRSSKFKLAGPPRTVEQLNEIVITYNAEGITFSPLIHGENDWIHDPLAFGDQQEAVSLLAQVEEEGHAVHAGVTLLMRWESVFQLSQSQLYSDAHRLLRLPPIKPWKPILQSTGGLTDREFAIILAGWNGPDGGFVDNGVHLKGALVIWNEDYSLMPHSAWRTVKAIARFHRRHDDDRTADSNRRNWAEIRRYAVAAGANLSDFLKHTVVVTPEHLHIKLRKGDAVNPSLVEVIPDFDGSPQRWIEFFDRMKDVPQRYEVPDAEGLTQVLPSLEVQSVLKEIKRMPGRRVVGDRAEAFIRNPFATLGSDADKVIDPSEFERARDEAGISFTRFSSSIIRDTKGSVIDVALHIEDALQGQVHASRAHFQGPEDLEKFIFKLEQRISRNAQCCSWNGYDLEILGETPEQLELLRRALIEWRTPRQFALSEILDLNLYSRRIESFGVEKPYYSPFVARKNNKLAWFPENVVLGVAYTQQGSSEPVALEFDKRTIDKFKKDLAVAVSENRESFSFAGCPQPIEVAEARRIISTLEEADSDLAKNCFHPDRLKKEKRLVERRGLVVKPNIAEVDYEERRGHLLPPADLQARLPGTLRPDFPLKEHQLQGVMWLQHLWSCSPNDCRGALLADDMGLGKTLQLLTFVATLLEEDSESNPCLIVAPVSLLENWKEEIEKFFESGTFQIVTLYGSHLSALRLSRAEIASDLHAAGVGRLLARNWVRGAKIVLTTYETLRDLEFSLAMEHWSIMICDEAQKIKNPNALVTRAAKKQNARFKIACTGTPVENTLTDLWCLFDFIQPGLLGALSSFGERYRKPIEAETEEEKARIQELRDLIEPQKLRRTKSEVAKDLPAKIDVQECRRLPLSERQRMLYASAIKDFRSKRAAVASGPTRNHLELLQYLRRLCTDPQSLYKTTNDLELLAESERHSSKLAWLLAELRKIREKEEKVIVFCEFRNLQRTLQRAIEERFGIVPDIINGDTSASADHIDNRQRRINRFQSQAGFGVIILSPLAIGFGVNIQAANHVVHFTRTWNPAKEDQATDRAYRIGQTKKVYVYYPVVVATDFTTFDAKLDSLLDWKRELSRDMLNGSGDLPTTEFLDLQDVDGGIDFT